MVFNTTIHNVNELEQQEIKFLMKGFFFNCLSVPEYVSI